MNINLKDLNVDEKEFNETVELLRKIAGNAIKFPNKSKEDKVHGLR